MARWFLASTNLAASKTMKKERVCSAIWFLAAAAVAIVIVVYVYASTGLTRCYWSNIDSDFCYAVAGLRFLDGMRSGFVEHSSAGVGLPLVQLLGWTYALASKAEVLSGSSFQVLASHPDPLLHLRQFVIAGWLSGALIFLLIVATIFWFTRLLTGSNLISFVASLIVSVSWSNLQFLLRIREEAFSAFAGLLSLYLMFRAVRAGRLSVFGYALVGAGIALAFSLFSKRNALPYLAFLPLVLLLSADTAIDRAQGYTRNLLLRYVFVVNLFLIAPMVLLVQYWPEFIASFTLSLALIIGAEMLVFISLLLLYTFLVFCVRLKRSYCFPNNMALLKRAASDTAVYWFLLMIGFELAVYASFVHPRPNSYMLFFLIVLIGVAVLAGAFGRRGQDGLAALMRQLLVNNRIFSTNRYLILAAIAWGLLWQVARLSPELFASHIEVAVSRVLFELVHPQSSISLLSASGHSSSLEYFRSVGAEWWGYYRGARWPELLIVALTLYELFLARNTAGATRVVLLMVAGMVMVLFSALRHLFSFYVIYEDVLIVLAVSLCFGYMVTDLRGRVSGPVATLRVTLMFGLAVALLSFSVVRRTSELRGMQYGDVVDTGCSTMPSGDTCLCDYFFAGTKYGGTGLKGIVEEQYGADCMQAVEARAAQGIP